MTAPLFQQNPPRVQVICAYCQTRIAGPADAEVTSHGQCRPCADAWMERAERDGVFGEAA